VSTFASSGQFEKEKKERDKTGKNTICKRFKRFQKNQNPRAILTHSQHTFGSILIRFNIKMVQNTQPSSAFFTRRSQNRAQTNPIFTEK
jgi:hypothetical protein